jgi:fructose-1,6-bisphosphatase/inositol monophosphatase family enzyme
MALADRVATIIRDVAATEVMPRFGTLAPDHIARKVTPGDPEDIVTLVDHRVEARLLEDLPDLVPGATFLAEEAAAADPGLIRRLSEDAPVWVIDPIDGTKNFASGNPRFGIMVALVQAGRTRASWIALPATGDMLVAEAGRGTSLNGTPVPRRTHMPERLRGSIHTRLIPGDLRADLVRRCRDRFEPVESTGAAATEYTDVIRGTKDFVLYYRLLPLDHAAGALAIVEAGGTARHLDGTGYSPMSTDQVTIFAASAAIGEHVRGLLT